MNRYRALDETAIFGRGCRHEFPKKFLNLKHGERSVTHIFLYFYLNVLGLKEVVRMHAFDGVNLFFSVGLLLSMLCASAEAFCIHVVALFKKIFYIFYRLSYAVYVLQELEKDNVDNPALKINILYDVACMLVKHLQVIFN